MPTVTFLVGLCGSGKTHYAEEILIERHEYFDCPHGGDDYPRIRDTLAAGTACVVEEVELCKRPHRESVLSQLAGVHDLEVVWVYFANDLETANHNVTVRRNKKDALMHRCINDDLSPQYDIPPGVEPIDIFRLPDPE